MTPERLNELAHWHAENVAADKVYPGVQSPETLMVGELLNYIDLLHEDLRITRQERDHAKHQALEHRKARARLEYDLLARDEKDTE